MSPREPRTRLVGRDVEVARLRALVDGAADGRGFALLLVGGAGLGKSRLAEAAADLGRAAGFAVRTARAHHLQVAAPYAVVLDAFGLRAGDLAAAPDAGAPRTMLEAGAMGAPSFLLGERLEEWLEEESLDRPVLLIIEDLHWADPASLAWLGRVVARVGASRVGVLATTRPPRPAGASAWALADWDGERLDLEPLSATAVAELAADALSAPPGPRLVDALSGAAGTPLLALALIDALQAAHALGADDGCLELERPAAELPAGDAVTAQLCEVEADTLPVLQVAAVLGRTLTLANLAAVLGRRVVDVLPALDDAVAAGVFLVDEPDGIGFRHELYRDAVLATLPGPAREALHLDVARTLAAAGAPALDVAEHFARGARPGNREAVDWLQRAAIDVVAHAPGTALRLLDIALPLCPSLPPPELLMARVQALAAAGHSAEAEALGSSLLREGLTPDVEARLRRELALSYFVQGRAAECAAEMDRVRELGADDQHGARLHAELAFARFVSLDHAAARESAATAVADGRRSGDVAAVVGGTAVLALLELLSDRFATALQLADEIDRFASQPNAIEAHIYQPWFAAGLVRLEADHLDDLARTVRHGRRVAERTGAAWAIPGYDALTAFAALRTGELDDADTIARAALDYLDGVDGFGVSVWCHAFAATAALHRGDDDAAVSLLDGAERVLGTSRQFGWEQVAAGRARWHERADRPDAALAALRPVWDGFGAFGILAGRQEIGPDLARLAVLAGEVDVATDVAAGLAIGADLTGTASFRVAAARAAAWAERDPDRAVDAVALARATPRRPTVAGALEDAAALLDAAGRKGESKACATEAADLWQSMGAPGTADHTAARFRVSTPKGRRPTFGFDALTASERRVIDLVADGLPNAEIARQLYISRRTVESHTSSAYRKLGVSSRVELATTALRARQP